MKKRIIILSLILACAVSGTVEASESDGRIDCGVEDLGNPFRAQVTAYCEPGKPTATGSYRQEGVVAASPEWIGATAAVYKVEEDGSIGAFIGYFPIADTGYGHSISAPGFNSEILKGQNIGTVETGLTLDFRQKSYTECKRWMVETFTGHGSTGSEVYVQIIKGVG